MSKPLAATPLLDRSEVHRPAGHTSVMAHRALAENDLDYFPTPPWAARAGGELIQRLDPGPWSCWEPACGGGHMAHGLSRYFSSVTSSDIHDHGGEAAFLADFLTEEADREKFDWIVTNPPFVLGDAFVRTAYQRARRGVAMLLRLVFLEGGKRYRLLHEDCPLSVVAPFSERVPMVKGRWDPEASSATAYAWFVWLKGQPGPAHVVPIPPGTRARLSSPGDVVQFNGAAATPLLSSVDVEAA